MKRTLIFFVLAFLFAACTGCFPQTAWAEMEWKIIKELDVKNTPLDTAYSADGKWLFILTPGEILVYSVQEEKMADGIPVGKEFERIAPSPRPDRLTISSSTKKAVQVILIEVVHNIDVTGLPFKGPSDAPVTIAVFTDYQ